MAIFAPKKPKSRNSSYHSFGAFDLVFEQQKAPFFAENPYFLLSFGKQKISFKNET